MSSCSSVISRMNSIMNSVLGVSAMFEAKVTNYINAYVCVMHMVNAISTAGINGVWLTLLSIMSDFQDRILD